MSISYIPDHVKYALWGKTAGRCEYEGCNKPIYTDDLTQYEFNAAYIAHIYADSRHGPRWHPVLSEQLKADIANLMLLCDVHHRLIDRGDVAGHPAERLQEMKRTHEERIALLSDIQAEKKSEILLYGAKVGVHESPLTYQKARLALLPERYPASHRAIELGTRNSSLTDGDAEFWTTEVRHLRHQFSHQVKARLALGEIPHLSIFALAPQPLLVELGRLLSDIPTAQVFQLHREPPDWCWQEHADGFTYTVIPATSSAPVVALNLSLSATITNDRITSILGEACPIWTMTVSMPHNDFLKSRQQLQLFREEFRRVLDRVKAQHGHDAVLHVFPAVPVAIAVEIGRVWMPKADVPLTVYDQHRGLGGFIPALEIAPALEGG